MKFTASTVLDEAIVAAVVLLRKLPAGRNLTGVTRKLFTRFNECYPDLRAKLITHVIPASDRVTYDLLLHLDHKAGGVISLGWNGDSGLPWIPQFADHWAANFVLSVNGMEMTIQSALLFLNSVLTDQPNLMEELIERSLLSEAISVEPMSLSEHEISRAVDNFRLNRGLGSAVETQRWLEETNLTMEALRSMVGHEELVRKFKQNLTRSSVLPYFRANRSNFESLGVLQVSGLTRPAAEKLARKWRQNRQFPFPELVTKSRHAWVCNFRTLFRCELAGDFEGKLPMDIVGPFQTPDGFTVAQILNQRPARLDAATRQRIQQELFGAWLKSRRSQATVRWHWM